MKPSTVKFQDVDFMEEEACGFEIDGYFYPIMEAGEEKFVKVDRCYISYWGYIESMIGWKDVSCWLITGDEIVLVENGVMTDSYWRHLSLHKNIKELYDKHSK